jgi:phosphate transport system permease protein
MERGSGGEDWTAQRFASPILIPGGGEVAIWGMEAGQRRRREPTRLLAIGFSALTALFFFTLVALFLLQSFPVFRHSGFAYLTGTRWFFRAAEFGASPMIYGTAAVAAVALLVAVPLALGAALWTAEILPRRYRLLAKGLIELLAGVPSVVYGLLGVLFLRQWVARSFERFDVLSGDTLLTGGLLLAVMVLPTLMTLADDALRGVPATQRQAARGLGLNRSETILRVVIPQAAPGLVAALLLALGRALGETIAVFLVIGRQDNQWPANLFSARPLLQAGQTLTTKLGGAETHLAFGDPLHWAALMALALVLLLMVTGVTVAGAALAQGRGPRA